MTARELMIEAARDVIAEAINAREGAGNVDVRWSNALFGADAVVEALSTAGFTITRAASPEMPEGISVRSYAVGETRITIEWRGEDSWCIHHCGSCLNTDGEWEYEPMPSNREDDYIARTRYPLNEAFRLAIAAGEKRAKHGVPQP